MSDPLTPKYLLLGQILRPHGVRGELRMRVLTDYPERLPKLKAVYLTRHPESDDITRYALKSVRFHQEYALLTLKEVPDRNAAELMRDLYVMVDFSNAVPLEADEIYVFQLIGMRVETDTGIALGTIQEVLQTGANDVYVCDGSAYGEVLIPITDNTLIATDTEARKVIVKPPEGLLPASPPTPKNP